VAAASVVERRHVEPAHEFVAQLVEWGRQGEMSYVPKMRTQLVAARTVAQALAELATDPESASESSGAPIPEIAGPHATLAGPTFEEWLRRGSRMREG
jgi:hypothetical protein